MWRKLLLLAASLALSLGVAELLLRAVFPVEYRQPPDPVPDDAWRELLHRPSAVPGLAYELRPGADQEAKGSRIRTNSLGLRDDEPPPADGAQTVRIAALGDSVTFGFGNEGSETYANVLERLLNERSPPGGARFEVLNFGVGGYAARDVAAVLEHKALALDPALVIYGYVLNDPEVEPIQPLHGYFQRVEWWQRSHLLRLIAAKRRDLEIARLGGGNYLRYLHAHPETWGSVLAAFDRMREVVREAEVPVIVAIFPVLLLGDEGWAGYPYREIHAQVAAAADSRGFRVLDLLPVYERHEPGALRVSDTDGHPNAAGHRLAAAALRYLLAAEPELLPPGAPAGSRSGRARPFQPGAAPDRESG